MVDIPENQTYQWSLEYIDCIPCRRVKPLPLPKSGVLDMTQKKLHLEIWGV